MDPIRSIHAATDLSAGGTQAALRAAWLAGQHGAALTLLHVCEPDVMLALRDLLAPGRDLARAAAEQAGIQLAALARDIEQRQGVRAEHQLRQGDVLGELNAAAGESDVLVLGASGASPVRASTLGTTAERVVRLTRRPVVLVRGRPAAPYGRVALALDFSQPSDAALHFAQRLAPAAELCLVHCYDAPFEGKLRLAGANDDEIQRYREQELAKAQQRVQELAGRLSGGRKVSTRVRQGDPRRELVQAARELGADLLAVGKRGRSIVGDALLGSTTAWVMEDAPCDVLIVPR